MLRPGLVLAGLLALAGCEQWHLSVNSDGLVFVSVIGDGGQPGERFRVRIRQPDGITRTLDLPPSGRLTLRSEVSGMLELTLLTPAGCQVAGPNPRRLLVSDGEAVTVAFAVRCA